MSSIEEIKNRIDLVDLVSESVQLRRSGKNYTGFCPFHPNTRTPAFVVFPETGTWHCFGQCNEGGDVFKFVMKKEGWDFPEALRYLAERAGVQLRPPTPQEEAQAEEHDQLRSLLDEAVTYFHHHLRNTPAGQQALEYCRSRGLADETLEAFGLGYAPRSWDACLSHFQERGYQPQELVAAGLASERESGGWYDRFRHRLMIPIRDGRGRMAGFGARSLDPDDQPKYLNSPQTELFDKGGLLYGLHRARKAIRTQDQVVIVEGYMDVIALHQSGFENSVSPMGTALTDRQLGHLKRLARRIVLALDADAAGDRATLRGLQVARQTLDREHDPVFDARGLLRHEARLRADIRVTTLPAGRDPDEVVRQDPQAWEEILAEAKPIVQHVMDTLAAGQDVSDAKVKSEMAAQVLPLIADLPDPIERDTYRQRLARLLQVDERTLLAPAARQPGPRRRRQTPATRQPQGRALPAAPIKQRQGAYCLGVLLRRPDLIYQLDRALQSAGLSRLSPDDFQDTDHQEVVRLIQGSLEQEHQEPMHDILANLSLTLMDLVDGLLAQTAEVDPNEPKVLEDLLRTILDLRRRSLNQSLNQLRFLMETAQEQGDAKASQYLTIVTQHTTTLDRLDRALKRHMSGSLLSGN